MRAGKRLLVEWISFFISIQIYVLFYVEHATVLYHSKQLLFIDLDSQKGTSIYWSKYFLSVGRLHKTNYLAEALA